MATCCKLMGCNDVIQWDFIGFSADLIVMVERGLRLQI